MHGCTSWRRRQLVIDVSSHAAFLMHAQICQLAVTSGFTSWQSAVQDNVLVHAWPRQPASVPEMLCLCRFQVVLGFFFILTSSAIAILLPLWEGVRLNGSLLARLVSTCT